MNKYMLLIILFIAACKGKQSTTVSILVDKSQSLVKVSGLTETTLNGIGRDSIPMEIWQSMLPICSMPADTEMRNYQNPIPGNYKISGNTISFKPDTAFKTGQTYFARYYHYDDQITSMDLVLHRRETGRANYTELIFKY